jgi:cyclophilin family peptidyl-prolyl cis-trans isomerase
MLKKMLGLATALLFATAAQAATVVEMQTNEGKITLELDAQAAPKTVANFLQYARSGFYNGTIFHRVIAGFMIQGGGFTENLSEKSTRAPIENEARNGLHNRRGTISMARTRDPHSASAQFFINVADNGFLDYPGQDGWGYAVFGKVTVGMDVVDRITKQATSARGGYDNVPLQPIIIQSVKIISEK